MELHPGGHFPYPAAGLVHSTRIVLIVGIHQACAGILPALCGGLPQGGRGEGMGDLILGASADRYCMAFAFALSTRFEDL